MCERVCGNCGRSMPRLTRGMCNACYKHQRKHGEPRRPENSRMWDTKAANNRCTCRNCHQAKAVMHELCNACDAYVKRNGVQRPRHLWAETCKTCKRPLRHSRKRGPDSAYKGECRTCYIYRYQFGKERPERLWRKVLWCDCGHPATHIGVPLTITLGTGHDIVEKYNLCDDCFALEDS